jgi:hypothetical protein
MIETMCNEILGNYTKKEDQLMIVAFGTRPKRRLNRVMDALNFKYPDYERLDKGAEGVKRKRIVSILNRQAARLVKEGDFFVKKAKSGLEPKAAISKKRKLYIMPSNEPKVDETGEEAPSTPTSAEVAEILKVMTDSPHFKPLSPLGSKLTQFFQKKEQPLAAKEKVEGQKKRRIVNVMQTVEQTPPSTSATKTVTAAGAEADAAAEIKKTDGAETTLSGIDRLISDVVKDVAIEEEMATAPSKEREIDTSPSGKKYFDRRHLGGQELSEEDKSELREFVVSCGYQLGGFALRGVDEEILGCIRDRAGAKIAGTLSNSAGFPKLEADISCYRWQHIVGSLFYSRFKVRPLTRLLLLSSSR